MHAHDRVEHAQAKLRAVFSYRLSNVEINEVLTIIIMCGDTSVWPHSVD